MMLIVYLPALFRPGCVGISPEVPDAHPPQGNCGDSSYVGVAHLQGDHSHRHILRNGPPHYSRPCAFHP